MASGSTFLGGSTPTITLPSLTLSAGPLSIGTTPASAGDIRLSKAGVIKALNNAGTGDIQVIGTNASDVILVGDATNTSGITVGVKTGSSISLQFNGSTTVAFTTGYIGLGAAAATNGAAAIGLSNNTYIFQNTSGGSARGLIGMDSSNVIHLGDGSNDLQIFGTKVAFFGGTPASKQTVTGSRGGNAALASLLTALATYGVLTDSSTA